MITPSLSPHQRLPPKQTDMQSKSGCATGVGLRVTEVELYQWGGL
jgi:hypothetical protein